MKRVLLIVFAALLVSAVPPLHAQTVIHHPNPDEALVRRWEWSQQQLSRVCSDGCWIGYSIQRLMEAHSYTGWHTTGHTQHSTLQMLVYGHEVEPSPATSPRGAAQQALENRARRIGAPEKVMKEVALLFRLGPGGQPEHTIRISNISLPVDLEARPLIWLGQAEQTESVPMLENHYARAASAELKENLISAIGMHDAAELVVPFLQEVLASREDEEIRAQAVFWLAEAEDPQVLSTLERTARNDASDEVREQAVFGISRIETDAADESLIQLARNLEDRETREQAIFWLGQKASEKAASNLEDIVANDPDLEIQKKAVFAISQLPEDEAVPRLINIARTHRNPNVRHDAIFWLGESGDPRAVDLLVEIVRGQ